MPISNTSLGSITDTLDQASASIVAFARDLISNPSENPGGDERAVAALIASRARSLGLPEPVVIARSPERPNLLFKIPFGGPGPTLMLNGHMDTKPVGDRARWTHDPFDPIIVDGRLCGLGSTDMKSALAAMIYAGAALLPVAHELKGRLILAFTADEEHGSEYGAEHLAGIGALEGIDAAILGEPSGITREWEHIHTVGRGFTAFWTRVRGTQMHSSCSQLLPSVNASAKMAWVLDRMAKEFTPAFPPHPLCPEGVTVSPGVLVRGGVTWGVYPGLAEFGTDIRTLPGMTPDALARDLEAFFAKIRLEDPNLRVEWEFAGDELRWIEPTEIPAEHRLVKAARWATERVLGTSPPLGTFPGATDATPFQHRAGIPCIPSLGPGMLPLAHGPLESVAVESIAQAAKIYALAAARFGEE